MKKQLFVAVLTVLALFALMGMGGNKEAAPQPVKPQFGVVETAKLYQESQVGKAGMARLEKLQNNALAKLEAMQADLKKAQDDKDEAKTQRLQVEMQGAVYAMQNALTAEQEKVVAAVRSALEKSMEQYRAEQGLFGIFGNETLLSYGKEADVTTGVMALMDKQTVDFGPEPSLEAAPVPAQPDAPVAPAATDAQAQPADPETGSTTPAPESQPAAQPAQ